MASLPKTATNFPATMHDFLVDMNRHLDDFYAARHAAAQPLAEDYALLWRNLRKLHQAGGKRLRPYLALLAYQAAGGDSYDRFKPVGAALEVLHTAMLIHDDIIDRDDTRHGQPNLNGIYSAHYRTLTQGLDEARHFATAAATLGGDLLISDTYQLVLSADLPPAAKVAICQLLGESLFTVIGGELLDTEAALKPFNQVDSLLIARLKTAAYTCAIPLEIGAALAGARPSLRKQLHDIGMKTGIAFQLADDDLGMFGDSRKTGKTTTGDLREGKRTYLLQQALAVCNAADRKQLLSIVGNADLTDAMAEKAQRIIIDCGARGASLDVMADYAGQAIEAVHKLAIASAHKQQLETTIRRAVWREA